MRAQQGANLIGGSTSNELVAEVSFVLWGTLVLDPVVNKHDKAHIMKDKLGPRHAIGEAL